MKTFILTEETAKGEFELLKAIWLAFKDNPKGLLGGFEIKTNKGIFVNKGGFNGNYFDLWLTKKGTTGQTKNTFWRVGLGNNKQFKLFIYDLRFDVCSNSTAIAIANKIGCKVTSGSLKHFIFDEGEPLINQEDIFKYIEENKNIIQEKLDYLDELKAKKDKETWQFEANSLIMRVCNNDFRNFKWKEIYELIRSKF